MNIELALLIVFIFPVVAMKLADRKVVTEHKQKTITVTIDDPMLVEQIQNLYDEQDIYEKRVYNLIKQNNEIKKDIVDVQSQIDANNKSVEISMAVNPNSDINILQAQCDAANKDLIMRKLKLEERVISNLEKIANAKDKSNAVTIKLNKIGEELPRL